MFITYVQVSGRDVMLLDTITDSIVILIIYHFHYTGNTHVKFLCIAYRYYT